MKDEIQFTNDDSVAIIAPHPDDECIGAAGVLIKIPSQTDVYVVTDGCYGNKNRSAKEEARLRREWFEEEMSIVKPHNWFWLGIEDTKISDNPDFATQIDFKRYTKVFLPWGKSLHPDHRATYESCLSQIKQQNANKAEYYMYEVCAPFHNPRYYIDISDVLDRKHELIRCHREMEYEIRQITLLNQFRASQLHEHTDCKCIEAFDKVEIFV